MSLAAGRPRPLLNADSLGGYELFHLIRFLGYLFLAATCASAVGLWRSEEHTSELQSRLHLVCRLLLEKKKTQLTKKFTEYNDRISPTSGQGIAVGAMLAFTAHT